MLKLRSTGFNQWELVTPDGIDLFKYLMVESMEISVHAGEQTRLTLVCAPDVHVEAAIEEHAVEAIDSMGGANYHVDVGSLMKELAL